MIFEIGVPNPLLTTITLVTGAAIALLIGWLRGQKAGYSPKQLTLCTLLIPLFTAFCSHLCYCLVSIPDVLYSYPASFWFTFWQNGQMFYGGILGALIALWLIGGRQCLRLMDAYAPSMALMIAFARIAEGFSGQGYGEYIYDESFFCQFPFATFDPYYEFWAWTLYLPEALWALAVGAVVLCLHKKAKDGDRALVLLGLYAAAQVVFESLRRDDFLRWGFVRCSEIFSAVTILIVLLCYHIRAGKGKLGRKITCWVVFAAMVVTCLMLEFATEKRAPFLTFLNELELEGCYAVMAGCCALMAGCVLGMRSTETALNKE